MKKYLILGGNGFIGNHIKNRLSENNKVVVADRYIPEYNDSQNIEYKYIDYCNCNDFTPYLEGVDTIIHLISTIVPNDNVEKIKEELMDNVLPTIKLIEDMVKNNIKKIIFLSSGGTIYGDHDINPISEREKENPICNYGIIKEVIEKYLSLYNRYYDFTYRIVRLANPYSLEIKTEKKQGIIPILIDKVKNDETINIWGDGNDIRDYIYIEDAIQAIIDIDNYNGFKNIFNVGTGRGISINQLIEIIKKEMQIENIRIEYMKPRKCDVKNNVLDIKDTIVHTGWSPTVVLEDGIKNLLNESKIR